MEKDLIKDLIIENQQFVRDIQYIKRDVELFDSFNYVFVGLRRAGKSYLMYQQIHELLSKGHQLEEILYFNFEDDRIAELQAEDLDLIKKCYEELYSYQPIFFLDEIQIVNHWEKFARRLADQKFRVYITGSNAKMLSSEIATTLGGRYIIQSVFPYSFYECLTANHIPVGNLWYHTNRSEVIRNFDGYFHFGGLPELQLFNGKEKRMWLSSLYNKIFFGDLVTRYSVRNDTALKFLIRKLAESVKQPSSFNRLANTVSSAGKKITTDTVIDYLGYLEETWLLFSVENYASRIVDKSSNKKYYFIDNGILNLFLTDPETSLLENIVAIQLKKIYGEDLYFYNQNIEVDFFLFEAKQAFQVSYSLKDEDTKKREVNALIKLADRFEVNTMTLITRDEEETIKIGEDKTIQVIPIWKWLLSVDKA